jgi:heptosyltransferase-2
MAEIQCRHFSGYKPCGKSKVCDKECPSLNIPSTRILVVSLEAMGAVLRSTVILNPLLRKYPNAHITWVTQAPSHQLLLHNPQIDRVLTTSSDDLLTLSALAFDVAFVVDKSLKAQGVVRQTAAQKIFGFTAHPDSGAILPATLAAQELWELGLSDHKKFFVNTKPETQLLQEALELGPYQRDHYNLAMTVQEDCEIRCRHALWSENNRKIVLGINTGASPVIPYKKFTAEFHREIIKAVGVFKDLRIVLLGGADEKQANAALATDFPDLIASPTDRGLRDGLLSVGACDLVLSGDSLGMHMAIALKKWTIAWFGPTCAHEIDLYDRGRKLLANVPCSPCWKRLCDRKPMCYDRVSVVQIMEAIEEGRQWKISSSKQLFSETSYSPSPSSDL